MWLRAVYWESRVISSRQYAPLFVAATIFGMIALGSCATRSAEKSVIEISVNYAALSDSFGKNSSIFTDNFKFNTGRIDAYVQFAEKPTDGSGHDLQRYVKDGVTVLNLKMPNAKYFTRFTVTGALQGYSEWKPLESGVTWPFAVIVIKK